MKRYNTYLVRATTLAEVSTNVYANTEQEAIAKAIAANEWHIDNRGELAESFGVYASLTEKGGNLFTVHPVRWTFVNTTVLRDIFSDGTHKDCGELHDLHLGEICDIQAKGKVIYVYSEKMFIFDPQTGKYYWSISETSQERFHTLESIVGYIRKEQDEQEGK
jgi:phage-related tail fiber protein